MSRQFSVRRSDHIEYALWLAFSEDGTVKMSRGQPSLGRDERAMALSVKVPLTLFNTPQLRANIEVADPGHPIPTIDLSAASSALRNVVGCDVEVTITTPQPEEPTE
ncbi:MAG TPA: hypothetical protein VGR19_05945 [Allosphingosinicella sp.]|nr:hypothetical protein [Allosphingosinicella sp.]